LKTEPGVEELRAEIASTTKEIVRLMGRRNQLAREVGVLKSKVSLPLEDQAVEDALLKEVLSECDRVGLDRAMGARVFQLLLDESKKTQGLLPKRSPMAIFAKALALERQGVKLIRLDVGEPDFAPPKGVLEACAQAMFGFKTHYTEPRGIPELTTALRNYLSRKQSFEADDAEVMATPSGRFAVYAALASVVRAGESAIVVEPAWPAYRDILDHIGAGTISVRTELNNAWNPSLKEVEQAIRPNTRALILSYPNNPTGKVISLGLFKDLVALADEKGLTVISDEVYREYSQVACPSILDRPPKKFVLTSSFSKAWAMTGFRVGYAVSSKETISSMAKIASLTFTSVPEFIQFAAIRALEEESEVRKNVKTVKERIDAVARALDRIGSLDFVKPDGAMYFFPALRDHDGTGDSFAAELLEKGVSVTPGSSFGDYPKSFRISLGQPEETLLEGVRRMGELLA
jgi:aspartate aminotransferase